MEREKRERIEERKEELVVLDEGIDVEDMAGPKGHCCSGAFIPLRW
jgi:hypothetical protein